MGPKLIQPLARSYAAKKSNSKTAPLTPLFRVAAVKQKSAQKSEISRTKLFTLGEFREFNSAHGFQGYRELRFPVHSIGEGRDHHKDWILVRPDPQHHQALPVPAIANPRRVVSDSLAFQSHPNSYTATVLRWRVCNCVASRSVSNRGPSRNRQCTHRQRNVTEGAVGLLRAADRKEFAEATDRLRLSIGIYGGRNEVCVGDFGSCRLGTEGDELFAIGGPLRQDDHSRGIRPLTIARQRLTDYGHQHQQSKKAGKPPDLQARD